MNKTDVIQAIRQTRKEMSGAKRADHVLDYLEGALGLSMKVKTEMITTNCDDLHHDVDCAAWYETGESDGECWKKTIFLDKEAGEIKEDGSYLYSNCGSDPYEEVMECNIPCNILDALDGRVEAAKDEILGPELELTLRHLTRGNDDYFGVYADGTDGDFGDCLYDGFEIHLVFSDEDGNCEPLMEPDTNPFEWEPTRAGEHLFWSVYGHCPEGGVDCIADFKLERKEEAYKFFDFLCQLMRNAKDGRDYEQLQDINEGLADMLAVSVRDLAGLARRHVDVENGAAGQATIRMAEAALAKYDEARRDGCQNTPC